MILFDVKLIGTILFKSQLAHRDERVLPVTTRLANQHLLLFEKWRRAFSTWSCSISQSTSVTIPQAKRPTCTCPSYKKSCNFKRIAADLTGQAPEFQQFISNSTHLSCTGHLPVPIEPRTFHIELCVSRSCNIASRVHFVVVILAYRTSSRISRGIFIRRSGQTSKDIP